MSQGRNRSAGAAAAAVSAGMIVASGLLSYWSSRKLRKKNRARLQDDNPPTLATLGSYLPLLIGVDRIAPIFAWVQQPPRIFKDDVRTDGWHLLCVGPVSALKRIWKDDRIIFDGIMTPTTHPSTVSTTFEDGSRFVMHWGEEAPAVDPFISAALGVDSAWPFMAHGLWINVPTGGGPFPTYEYELEVQPYGVDSIITSALPWNPENVIPAADPQPILAYTNGAGDDGRVYVEGTAPATVWKIGYPCYLSGTGGADGTKKIRRVLPVSSGAINKYYLYFTTTLSGMTSLGTIDYPEITVSGANPAAIIAQLLFASWPHGLGLSTTNWEISGLDSQLAAAFAPGGTDPLYAHLSMVDGMTFEEALALILQDLGVGLGWSPVASDLVNDGISGAYRFQMIRKPDPSVVPHLNQDLLVEVPERSTTHRARQLSNSVSYSFKDRYRSFRDMPIRVTQDGRASLMQQRSSKSVPLTLFRDFASAGSAAERRSLEDRAVPATYELKAKHGARLMWPGQAFTAFDIPEILRVASITPQERGPARIQAVLDHYGVDPVPFERTDQGVGPSSIQVSTPVADLMVGVYEVPGALSYVTGGEPEFWVARARANSESLRAGVYLNVVPATESLPYGSFEKFAETEDVAVGGNLHSTLYSFMDAFDASFLCTLVGPDVTQILDLSGDEHQWLAGRQLLLIEQEICYVRSITVDSIDIFGAITYRLDGIIRGCHGTQRATHAGGTPFFIIPHDYPRIRLPHASYGDQIAAKTTPIEPVSGLETAVNDAEASDYLEVRWLARQPQAVFNMRNKLTYGLSWLAGEDFEFAWSRYDLSSYARRTGASYIPIGEPIEDDVELPTEKFHILIMDTLAVVIYETTTTEPSLSYTNAALVGSYGSEPDRIVIQVIHEVDSIQSAPVVFELEKLG